jgi:hypothetical protein
MFEQTLEIPEAEIIFYGKDDFWQIQKKSTSETIRQEKVMLFWSFTRVNSKVVVLSEIEAECVDFNGNTFHKVFVDPPHHIKEFDTHWEFDCDVIGKQILKVK